MATQPIKLTRENFKTEALEPDIPVVVDFWAGWCSPCQLVEPVMEEIAAEYQGRAKICKVDVDAYPDLAERFHVRGIPAILFFRGGQPVDRIIGAQPKESISTRLDQMIRTSATWRG